MPLPIPPFTNTEGEPDPSGPPPFACNLLITVQTSMLKNQPVYCFSVNETVHSC